jgi:plasmid stabilization system protein ParE
MSVRRLTISLTARKELREIWTYLAIQASPGVADRVLAEIRDALDLLAEMPGMGHTRNDVRDPRYRFWNVKSYVIAYRFTARTLSVARVVHGRRDFRQLFT